MTQVYEISPIKRRQASKAEMEQRREALFQIVSAMQPMTVRQAFYQATIKNIVEKTEPGYDKVQRMLQGPDMAEAAKAFRLVELCGDELNDKARKFVQVLAGNKRLSLLTEITIQFETLSALEQRSLDVVVISAYPLSADEELTLKASLRVRFDKEISMTSEVDSKLIGGAIIRAGDTVIDGSLRGKLDKLAETIQRT